MLVSTLSTVCHKQAQRGSFCGICRFDLDPVVKNPLSPIEHPGGAGVNCELFELGVEQFVVSNIERILISLRHRSKARVDCISSELRACLTSSFTTLG